MNTNPTDPAFSRVLFVGAVCSAHQVETSITRVAEQPSSSSARVASHRDGRALVLAVGAQGATIAGGAVHMRDMRVG